MVWLKESRALGKQDEKNLFKKSTGYPLDKPHKVWYNISVVRKRTEASRTVQKNKKPS
jgi:hypothetical protein